MSDPDRPKQGAPSIGEAVGNVLGTVVEIGWSLLAAGRGVLSMASRLVRLAQEQWRPPPVDRRPADATAADAIEDRAVGPVAAPPADRLASRAPRATARSSAVAFDEDALPPAPQDAGIATPVQERAAAPALSPDSDLEPESPALPHRYGVDRLGVLPRDPGTVFAWWEVGEARRQAAAREIDVAPRPADGATGEAAAPTEKETRLAPPDTVAEAAPHPTASGPGEATAPPVLREAPSAPPQAVVSGAAHEPAPAPSAAAVDLATPQLAGEALRVTALADDGSTAGASWIVPLPPRAASWYVEVPRTSHRFEIALGLVREGRFVPLLEPQRVDTPVCEVSRDDTLRWRAVGQPGAFEGSEPLAPGVEALWDEVRRRPLPASADWPPSHRLELDLGGSHGLPRS